MFTFNCMSPYSKKVYKSHQLVVQAKQLCHSILLTTYSM